MEMLLIVVAVLLYFLIGVIYSLCYILNYKPETKQAIIGVWVTFWLFMIVIDILLEIWERLGGKVKHLAEVVNYRNT